MEEKTEGKRVAKKDKAPKGARITLAALGCAAAVYLALCGYVTAAGRILPNVTAAGVNLGGLTAEQAEQRLDEAVQERYAGKTVTLSAGETQIELDLDKAGVEFRKDEIIAQAQQEGQGFFLTQGGSFLVHLLGLHTEVALQDENGGEVEPIKLSGSAVNAALAQAAQAVEQPVMQHEFTVNGDVLELRAGQEGLTVDRKALEHQLLTNLAEENFDPILVEAQATQPEEMDFEALYEQIHVEPSDAAMDPETHEFIPGVTGVSFDVAEAQNLFQQTAPGEICQVPLMLTEPEIDLEKLSASLFHDLLGEAKSNVSGSSNRVSNVRLAASFCDGVILMPGEVFSYWDKIGPCTASQGFLPAPSYQNGLTVDSIGGGVCQMSSSIYYAALLSNLEIVERRNHSFAVGYLPDGADATVAGGNPDFKFKNNTAFPIKIVASMSGTSLTVQIWGTKTDDTYVEMQFVRLSTTNPTTTYKIDDSVPAGTTKTSVTSYTGRVVEAYRCVYNGDGTLISKTLESKNYYQKRDAVVLVNPADAAQYGLEGGTAPAAPEPSPEPPVESAPPAETTPPVETQPPAETPPEANETPQPEPTSTPAESVPPESSFEPIGPGTGEDAA